MDVVKPQIWVLEASILKKNHEGKHSAKEPVEL